ncbi:MAG: hypothetical protein A2Y17_07480 [Clostridiales bacterium GWF2_38_85]|nr:MAG: hypothetical protein A2Y17_07480 [Clostridiales bacterium GWF2_38_85]HBL84285.1 hypothetical protein [Clostridiales bacterium]
MAWIELHQTLPQNKKILRLMSLLRIDSPQAVGHLCMLWLWALDNAQDGDLSQFLNSELAFVSGWRKKPDDFVNSLISAGFLEEDKKIHDWYDYAGKLIDKRKSDAERKRASRDKATKEKGQSDGSPSDCPNDILKISKINLCDGAGNRTVPNRTVPNQINILTTDTNQKLISKFRVLAGISNRGFSENENNILKLWFEERKYPFEMVEIAYNINIDSIQKYNINYINAVLERWYIEGVTTPEQAKADIDKHKEKNKYCNNSTYDFNDFFQLAVNRTDHKCEAREEKIQANAVNV